MVFPKGVWLAQIGIDRLYMLIPYIYWLSIPEKALYLLIFLFPIDIDWCFPGQKEPSLTVASPWPAPLRSLAPGLFGLGGFILLWPVPDLEIHGDLRQKTIPDWEIHSHMQRKICEAMVLVYLPTYQQLGDFVWANVGVHIPAPWFAYGIEMNLNRSLNPSRFM